MAVALVDVWLKAAMAARRIVTVLGTGETPETDKRNRDAGAFIRVRLLYLVLTVIVVGTAIPVEVRSEPHFSANIDAVDLVVNVLLYLPLGLALPRLGLARVLLIAGGISAAVEILQLWHFARYASIYDVVANALGAGAGRLLWYGRRREHLSRWTAVTVDGRTAAIAAFVAVALVSAWSLFRSPADLSNWDASYPLLVGDEATRDRLWRGDIASIALFADRADAARLSDGVKPDAVPPGLHLMSAAAPIAAADVASARAGQREATDSLARLFLERAVASGSFAVVARVRPENLTQDGPARVVSFSRDQWRRNFDLGQEGRRLVFRVRTPSTDENGMWPHVVSEPALRSDQYSTVTAAFDGSVSRVFVDGVLLGRANLEAAGCVVPNLCDSDLPLAAAVLGAALSVLLLHFIGRASALWRCGMALSSGIGAGWLARASFEWPSPSITVAIGLAAMIGAAAVCLAVAVAEPATPDGPI